MEKRDLTKQVTVFIISCGKNPNFEDCYNAIINQSAKLTIDIIRDYSPMSAAFQEMLNRCKTSYYVEVDEDMILDKNTIEIMYNEIKLSDEKTAMIAYKLFDVHLSFEIYGVKIYKNEVFQKYSYNLECLSCEVEQMDRMQKDGYKIETIDKVAGKHSPKWTEADIFYS